MTSKQESTKFRGLFSELNDNLTEGLILHGMSHQVSTTIKNDQSLYRRRIRHIMQDLPLATAIWEKDFDYCREVFKAIPFERDWRRWS
jgi:hypothetical protein